VSNASWAMMAFMHLLSCKPRVVIVSSFTKSALRLLEWWRSSFCVKIQLRRSLSRSVGGLHISVVCLMCCPGCRCLYQTQVIS
jgi:hypothetical protein